MLVGARLGVGQLPLQLGDRRLQCRHLIAEKRDLAFQKSDVGSGHRREEGSHLRRQCRLLVHAEILTLARPSAYPSGRSRDRCWQGSIGKKLGRSIGREAEGNSGSLAHAYRTRLGYHMPRQIGGPIFGST